MPRHHLTALSCLFLLTSPAVFAGGPRTVVSHGSARVEADEGDRVWTVRNDLISLLITLDSKSNFAMAGIGVPDTKRRIDLGSGTDLLLNVAGGTLRYGVAADGWRFVDTVTAETDGGVRLGFIYELEQEQIRATRWYAAYPNTPTIETWTRIEKAGSNSTTLNGLSLWNVTVAPGGIDWLTGLQVPEGSGEPFTLQHSQLGPGDQLNLGAAGRSSEFVVPWFAVDQGLDKLYVGLLWSGAWGATIRRRDGDVQLSVGLPSTVTTVSDPTPVETPHLFFGVARGPSPAVAASLRPFLRDSLRSGRGWDASVTYNTWFAYGTRIDEDNIRLEIGANVALGTETFVLDAGWYPGDGEYWDFTAGLGSWEVDPDRFPNGLGVLADDARAHGMRFGIWVEPERVALETVGRPGLAREQWLATVDGVYNPNALPEGTRDAQICLADPNARQWVFDQLVQFIDRVRPDYLKWDNNMWVNCNRPGHSHGPGDGNFRHVQSLYDILARLRARYPKLVIENVSGGGNRLDFGMARLTDIGWMDDRSAPSAHVRHNLEGLSAVFPPAYLLSFMMDHRDEPIVNPPDLSLYMRSRMPGVLGLSLRADALDDEPLEAFASEVALYKKVRDVLREGTSVLLTPQVGLAGVNGGWDAVQTVVRSSNRSVLFVFQQDPAVDNAVIRPTSLDPACLYIVRSADDGAIGTATGADLMTEGLRVHTSPRSRAQVIFLDPAPPAGKTALRR